MPSGHPGQLKFSCWASNFSFSLAQWVLDPGKSSVMIKKEVSPLDFPGQAKFESCFSERQAAELEFKFF